MQAYKEAGVDMLHLERCMDLQNVRAALAATDSLATETPVLITAEIEGMGSMLDGTLPETFVDFARPAYLRALAVLS